LLLLVITFMRDIYNYILEKTHVSGVYIVEATQVKLYIQCNVILRRMFYTVILVLSEVVGGGGSR
jgi:hypothetical protein